LNPTKERCTKDFAEAESNHSEEANLVYFVLRPLIFFRGVKNLESHQGNVGCISSIRDSGPNPQGPLFEHSWLEHQLAGLFNIFFDSHFFFFLLLLFYCLISLAIIRPITTYHCAVANRHLTVSDLLFSFDSPHLLNGFHANKEKCCARTQNCHEPPEGACLYIGNNEGCKQITDDSR